MLECKKGASFSIVCTYFWLASMGSASYLVTLDAVNLNESYPILVPFITDFESK